jgi:DNA polymerase III delta prime subunit
MQHERTPAPLHLFYSYADADEPFQEQLEKHLRLLSRQGLIVSWHHRQIVAGTDWAHVIDTRLMTAQVILLLISPDFLASDYCYGVEMQRAIARHKAGEAQVIPILLRPVDWESAPFAFLQCLPRGAVPITQWENQDEALMTVAKSIRAVIEQSHPPVMRASARHWQASQPKSSTKDGNRERMLERVRTIWITGMLEHSLHGRALITLGLSEESKVLANPWRLVVQEVDHPKQPLPAGTRITEVYDESGGSLLILGEPGSGKTTLLLELARDFLDRARLHETHPIPVIFNLSSWAVKRQPLVAWVLEELNLKYQVPLKLGQSWMRDDQILPLLDGLDEVPSTDRPACVEAINTYRQDHGFLPLVVCSRSADYLALSKQVLLHSAVTIQPLTSQQIEMYLSSAGEQLAAVRAALHGDPVLQELATTPLMLNVLTLTYQGTSLDQVGTGESPEVRQQQVFSAYVERMQERRGGQTRYSQKQTMQWLGWLARQLSEHHQTEFYLERMQPDWLAKGWILRLYFCMSSGLLGALLVALVGGVVSGLLGSWTVSLSNELVGGSSLDFLFSWINQLFGWAHPTFANTDAVASLAIGLVGGFLVGLVGGSLTGLLRTREGEIKPVEVVAWSWRTWPRDIIASLVIGLLCVFLIGLFSDPVGVSVITPMTGDTSRLCLDSPCTHPSLLERLLSILHPFSDQLIKGLVFGGVSGLVSSFLGRKLSNPHPYQGRWESMRIGVIVGLVDWLVGLQYIEVVRTLLDRPLGRLLNWSTNDPKLSLGILVGGLIGILLCWLVGGLTFGLLNGFSRGRLEKHFLVVPNQGILRSARISLFAGLLAGLTCILLFALTGLSEWSIESLWLGLFTGLIFAPFVGLLVGLYFGGIACIKHVFLRVFLWCMRYIPWNYSRFLDYAAERILLRKIGGGYIFVHRLLLDYFASLEGKGPLVQAKNRKHEQFQM